MNYDDSIGMNYDDSIDVVIYLCSKMGINVSGEYFGYRDRDEKWKGTIMGHVIEPILEWGTPAIRSVLDLYTNRFSWNRYDMHNVLKALCLWIKGFRLRDINTEVVNPFFKAESILDAKTKEEAFIQADMWFPGNNSEKIFNFIRKKLCNDRKC